VHRITLIEGDGIGPEVVGAAALALEATGVALEWDRREAGAAAAGCEMEVAWLDPAYDNLVDVEPFCDLYADNAARLGRVVADHRRGEGVVGSTDMGNVSHLVPSIHPMIKVSPPDVAIHTQDFVRFARGEHGDRAVLDGAKAMAMTVADLWLSPGALTAVREAFAARDSAGQPV